MLSDGSGGARTRAQQETARYYRTEFLRESHHALRGKPDQGHSRQDPSRLNAVGQNANGDASYSVRQEERAASEAELNRGQLQVTEEGRSGEREYQLVDRTQHDKGDKRRQSKTAREAGWPGIRCWLRGQQVSISLENHGLSPVIQSRHAMEIWGERVRTNLDVDNELLLRRAGSPKIDYDDASNAK
jgi:hypothetical protein